MTGPLGLCMYVLQSGWWIRVQDVLILLGPSDIRAYVLYKQPIPLTLPCPDFSQLLAGHPKMNTILILLCAAMWQAGQNPGRLDKALLKGGNKRKCKKCPASLRLKYKPKIFLELVSKVRDLLLSAHSHASLSHYIPHQLLNVQTPCSLENQLPIPMMFVSIPAGSVHNCYRLW